MLLDAVHETIRSVNREVLAQRIRNALDTDARPALQALEKPVLCLSATQDKICGDRGLEAILAAKPDAATAAIDGPHLLLQRKPHEAVAAIEKFLSELRN